MARGRELDKTSNFHAITCCRGARRHFGCVNKASIAEGLGGHNRCCRGTRGVVERVITFSEVGQGLEEAEEVYRVEVVDGHV